jgi:predicted transcriptional regulator
MSSQELAERLQQEIQKRGWNPSDLARAAGVPYESARRALIGDLDLRLSSTTKLVVACGLTIALEPVEVANS